jgi:hypothetical protein
VSKNKKQQEALQRAQKFVSGNKLNKSEVKKLEDKGFSSKQIQAVASSMNKVGSNAQQRIDNKHTPSGGGGNTSNVRSFSGDIKAKVDNQGRAISSGPITNQQAAKINKKVDSVGGSLVGGKGMAVSRYVTITDRGSFTSTSQRKAGGPLTTGSGKQQFAIYAPVAQPKTNNSNNKGGGNSSSSGSAGKASSSASSGAMQSAYKKAQDQISGRTPEGRPPELSPYVSTPGRAIEGVASYADRLGTFNANYSGWMQDRAEADRYESGTMLRNFANVLPKAPDVLSAKDMIDMANRMNKRIQVG